MDFSWILISAPLFEKQNENPRNFLLDTESTALLSLLTLSFSLFSIRLIIDFITLFPALLLLTYTLLSSAYLQNLCPLFSSSLSNSSSIIFASNGLNGPPCGVPSSLVIETPLIRTPLLRYFLINANNLLSCIFFSSLLIRIS